MKSCELLELFEKSKHSYHLVGTEKNGVIIGLSLEGRFFTSLSGEIVSRVNPEVFVKQSSGKEYVNPGGDGLWPAPEGSCLGYEYSTGSWRVPPGITNALYRVVSSDKNKASVSAEIDLINNMGRGIPAIFSRNVAIEEAPETLTIKSVESIEYAGTEELSRNQCLLAPWSLSQFDCMEGCEVVLPAKSDDAVWDLYGPSDEYRRLEKGLFRIKTGGGKRFQVGIGAEVGWIEYRNPYKKIAVRRQAETLEEGYDYFDIADRSPEEKPRERGVRYSVYNDAGCFMEIEAAGGVPPVFKQNTSSAVSVTTIFKKG